MERVTIKTERPAYGGVSIGRWNNKIIMVKGALPGETVEAVIEEERRDYYTASVARVSGPSPDRVAPGCIHFGLCGGCSLQYVSHERQTTLKEEVLQDCLKRLAKIETRLLPPLALDNSWGYRYRGQFKVSHGKIGFYREKTREAVDIERCPLMDESVNKFLHETRDLLKKTPDSFTGISEAHISCGNSALAFLKESSKERLKTGQGKLASLFLNAGFAGVFIESRDKKISRHGAHYTTLPLENLYYTVSPVSFFQSYWKLNQIVVEHIKGSLQPLVGKRVLDLYSGAGNFSLPLALDAQEVIAVEENPSAIEDGKRNVQINGIQNCRFIRSSAEKIDIEEKIHILILDPPRLGLANRTIDRVAAMMPERIVYISCNPSTLARDLKKLSSQYDIESVRMIDFFPHTFHIESLVFLRLR